MGDEGSGSGGAAEPLVGRGADLARLRDFLGEVPRGAGALALLGEPGVGKTALLDALAREAEGAGMRVLHTTGVQYRAQAGYAALRQLLTALPESRTAAAHAPVLASALEFERGLEHDLERGSAPGSAPGHDAVADAVVSLVVDLAGSAPTLVVVDDVQWLDRASAVVLGRVARRLAGAGTGMLCASRLGEASFFDRTGLESHELGPLSEAAAEELLIRHFPALAPRVRRRLMADAEGNPLALLELPAALTDSQRAAAQALPQRIPLTQRLQSTFASRITTLPAATRHLLLVAALEGSGHLRVVVRAVAGRCDLKHLAPAERLQLVRVDEATGRLTFRHSLMRSAVVELSTSDQRRGAHRALAQAWDAVPEQRAWHLAQASVEPDEQIAELLEQVADISAQRGDGPNAVSALVRAAELSPATAAQARRLAKAAYMGANLTGDVLDVPRLLDDARRVAPDADSPAAAVAAALYLLNSYGDIDTAHRVLRGAIALQPQPYDLADTTLREALSTLLMVCVYGGRPELWAECDEALAKCVNVPDTLILLRATFADPARALPSDWARLDAAVAALPGSPDPIRIVRIGTAAAYADRLGAMDEPLRRTARGGRTGENNFPAIQASFLWGSHAWFTGQWTELRQVVGNGLDLCDEYHYPLRSFTGKWALACVAAACGDETTARGLADQMDQWAGSRRAHAVRCYAAHARALLALSQGRFDDAYHHACTITPAGTLAPFTGHALWTVLDLAEAAVRSGRRGRAVDHVRAARAAGLDGVSPRLRMVLLGSAALAAEDEEEAVQGFDAALAVEGAERWPFDQARIQLWCGERLRRGKDEAEARLLLGAAARTFARLGAEPWTARAHSELRACDSPASARVRPDGHVLTPQQWQIATLAAAGLSNKQIGQQLFLSPRTVSTHLYQAFPKLGVTSRAALRDALEERDQR
ncbi:helix-turn-helix transcriptional regulator [Streptacidiphilus anmyonensis]|uniref:helix-turn-helix transcriptional regulator n=1 Tax=Streptacidiphilus anmyonensis TaxID=405782 RepID=UPI0005A74B98|nr:LuxR family transcriptional regulator [Streptacidiphilus anmyonensis]